MKATQTAALARPARHGFTLVELAVALTIFTVLGYSLISALRLSDNSRTAVADMVEQNEQLRAGAGDLSDALRLSTESRVTITNLADENHELTLQLPVVVGGALGWGVPASYLSTAGATDQENWSLRYTVIVDAGGTGSGERSLVRQVLDDGGALVDSLVLVKGVLPGDGGMPGFEVEKTGDVWEVTLSLDKGTGKSEVFHVFPRN